MAELLGVIESLRAHAGGGPSPPLLGYGGCFVRCGGPTEWLVFGGIVTLTTPSGEEVRADPGRAFERLLYASAPSGLLPPWTSVVPDQPA
jgi:hypothetical protein